MSNNPFALWADLWSAGLQGAANAARIGEMMRDSAEVVSRRTTIIASACREPGQADLSELGRMVVEKQQAMRDAGLAVAGDMARLQRDFGRQWAELARASTGRAAAATAFGSIAMRQAAMVGTMTAATDKATRPFHRRAHANAKRLRRHR